MYPLFTVTWADRNWDHGQHIAPNSERVFDMIRRKPVHIKNVDFSIIDEMPS
jgi:uncharacterized protein YggT (Ycf19 family)